MIGDRRIVFAQPLQRSNLCASHRQRRWLTYLSYTQAIRSRVTVNWATVPTVTIDPGQIPPEVEMKAALPNNLGKMSLSGPGRLDEAGLAEFRATRRLQELVFELARTLTRDYVTQPRCLVPAHVLFPQLVPIIERYLRDNVKVKAPGDKKDVFLSPYFGWVSERLVEAIQPDTSQGEAPEVPRYETSRGPGSTAEVDTWTSRDVREVVKSHVNYVVADTKKVGTGHRVLPRQEPLCSGIREKCGSRICNPVSAQRANAGRYRSWRLTGDSRRRRLCMGGCLGDVRSVEGFRAVMTTEESLGEWPRGCCSRSLIRSTHQHTCDGPGPRHARLRAAPRGPATARVTVGVVTDWLWQTPLRFFRQRPSPNPCGNDTIRRRASGVNVITNGSCLAEPL